MTKAYERLCALCRTSLLDAPLDVALFKDIGKDEWKEVIELARYSNLLAVSLGGISASQTPLNVAPNILNQWISYASTIQTRYERTCKAAQLMGEELREHGIEFLIMKGLALSRLYPRPEERESSDIDIYAFGAFDALNRFMEDCGRSVDYENEKHSVFFYNKVMVENHANFVDKGSDSESILNRFLEENSSIDKCHRKGKLIFPSADFEAIFLLRHMTRHFVYGECPLRNIIDWGLFVKEEGKHIDIEQYRRIVQASQMVNASDIFTSLASEILGIDLDFFLIDKVDKKLKDRVLKSLLDKRKYKEKNLPLLRRICAKANRLIDSRWKFREFSPDQKWWDRIWKSALYHIRRPDEI